MLRKRAMPMAIQQACGSHSVSLHGFLIQDFHFWEGGRWRDNDETCMMASCCNLRICIWYQNILQVHMTGICIHSSTTVVCCKHRWETIRCKFDILSLSLSPSSSSSSSKAKSGPILGLQTITLSFSLDSPWRCLHIPPIRIFLAFGAPKWIWCTKNLISNSCFKMTKCCTKGYSFLE